MATYEENKAAYAKLKNEMSIMLRAYDALDVIDDRAAVLEIRAAYSKLSDEEARLHIEFLSNPETRWGDWQTKADVASIRSIGWSGLLGNAKCRLMKMQSK